MTTLILAIIFWLTPATLQDGKCTACMRYGVKSTVWATSGTLCTLMGCSPGYYDENGKWVPPDRCNTCTTSYRCSRGHRMVVRERSF